MDCKKSAIRAIAMIGKKYVNFEGGGRRKYKHLVEGWCKLIWKQINLKILQKRGDLYGEKKVEEEFIIDKLERICRELDSVKAEVEDMLDDLEEYEECFDEGCEDDEDDKDEEYDEE